MKYTTFLLASLLLWTVTPTLFSQEDSENTQSDSTVQDTVYEKSEVPGIIVKKLLVDYNGPFDGEPFDFIKWNGGFELGVRLPINYYLNIAIPFKASSVSLPETSKNVNIFSLDLQGQVFPLQTSKRLQPYMVAGIGGVLENGSDLSLAIPAGLGANLHINHRIDLNLELAYRFGFKDNRDNYQLGIGFIYNLDDRDMPRPVMPPPVEEKPLVQDPMNPLVDSDGDGIPDIYDLCPNTPGLAEFMGCPDSDGDGIPDHLDRCPNQPGPLENHGCPWPEKVEEVVEEEVIEPEPVADEIPEEIKEVLDLAMKDVQFDLGRATLRPESFGILNQIAAIMEEYPQYQLRISGHTDNIGSATNNQRLSEQRARSCYEYLASRGVSTARMSFVGFGESKPIDTNDTPRGRSNNRRVEFHLYID
nr:OmpA family protein [Saprospiraceae bacterium]